MYNIMLDLPFIFFGIMVLILGRQDFMEFLNEVKEKWMI